MKNLGEKLKLATKKLFNGSKRPEEEQPAVLEEQPALISTPESTPSACSPATGSKPMDKSPARKSFFIGGATAAPAPGGTIIADGDTLQGNLQCTGDIEVYGIVIGDIAGKGDIKICGKQDGNATGHNIEMFGGQIKGCVAAAGSLKMNDTSVVIGNISAETLILNGKVKGDLDIQSSVTLEKNAVVSGKISAGSISAENGAVMQGEVVIRCPDLPALTVDEVRLGSGLPC